MLRFLSKKIMPHNWRSLSQLSRRPLIDDIRGNYRTTPPHQEEKVEHENFYRPSKRWLYNENKRMYLSPCFTQRLATEDTVTSTEFALRYVRFNVHALQRVAARAVGANNCVFMEKTAEGSFNKVFTLRFDTGAEVIARIPCPIAGPSHLIVASEVATLDFVRTRLRIPVPKVLAWSSHANNHGVEADYIIMEKLGGVPLSHRWLDIGGDDIMTFISKIIAYEKRLSSVQFSQIGNLYFKEDVELELQNRRLYADGVPDDEASDKYRIGPTLQREFWRGERGIMDIDRGPWPDVLSYASAIFKCEQLWLTTHAHPRALDDPFRLSEAEESPETHLEMLKQFTSIAPFIVPNSEICHPILWHTDLHDSNILVEPVGFPEIIGIIDWQEWIGPKFFRAVFPRLLNYEGDMINLRAAAPSLPEDFEELSEERQAEARLQLRLAARHRVYEHLMRKNDPSHHKVLNYPHLSTLFTLFRSASRTWTDGLLPLRQALIEVATHWHEMVGPDVTCPLTFTKDELDSHAHLYKRAQTYENRSRIIHEVLKLEPDGEVESEHYEEMKEAMERLRKVWDAERDGVPWPLQEGGWSSLL